MPQPEMQKTQQRAAYPARRGQTCGSATRAARLRGLGPRPMAVRYAIPSRRSTAGFMCRRADAGRGSQWLVQAEQDVSRGRHLQHCHEPHGAASLVCDGGACNAMRPTSTRQLRPPARVGEPAASCASCHMPTRTPWWSTRGTITAFRIRGRTCRRSRHANFATLPHGQVGGLGRSAIEMRHGPNRKGFQNYAEALRRRGPIGRREASCVVAADRSAPAIARASADRAATRVSPEHQPGAAGVGSRSDGADRRSTPRKRAGRADLAAVSAAASDPTRGVRIRALIARHGPTASQPAADRNGSVAAEFSRRTTPQCRPESRRAPEVSLRSGSRTTGREAEYSRGCRARKYAPAAVNLADSTGGAGGSRLERAARRAAASPEDAGIRARL